MNADYTSTPPTPRPEEIAPGRISWPVRLAAAAVGTLLLGLLGVASGLTPDSRGYGTHQGLYLPPCTIQEVMGIRCPSCGMTTSWAWLMRGRILRSAAANCGGLLLGALACLLAPWLLVSAILGRWWIGFPSEKITILAGLGILLVVLGEWLIRLGMG